MAIQIKARLPNGKRVHHGDLERGEFRREIPHHHVRFSDMSFCLNTSVISELSKRNCHTLVFVWLKKEFKEIYVIDFKGAVQKYPPIRNEYNEENLRIPISDCWLKSRIKRANIPESERREWAKQDAAIKAQPKAEPDPQVALF